MTKVSSSDGTADVRTGPALAPERVWSELSGSTFAVLSYVTPAGEPRSSGVLYGVAAQHLYAMVAADSWKARSLRTGDAVSVTVPIRRGGLLSLIAPIPPATITFQATVIVHPPGTLDLASVSERLASLLPARNGVVLEVVPHATFLTYGIGVSLKGMSDPARSKTRVPVA